MPLPCDRHVSIPDAVYHRAIDVEAPPAVVFRWLCQLRAAPYSYDLIDNLGRRSPRTLTPGLEELEEGQRVMTIFELVEFERDRHLTLRLRHPRALRELAVSYVVLARDEARSRLLVRLAVGYRGGRLGAATVGTALPLGDLVMMRKQLRNLKRLSEQQAGGR